MVPESTVHATTPITRDAGSSQLQVEAQTARAVIEICARWKRLDILHNHEQLGDAV